MTQNSFWHTAINFQIFGNNVKNILPANLQKQNFTQIENKSKEIKPRK